MKYLRELNQVLTNVPKAREDFYADKSTGRPKDQFAKLYEGIAAREFSTDQAAIQAIYGGDATKQGAYAALKSRLRERLLNSLFLLDPKPPLFSESTRAFYRCQKALFWSSVLIRFSARNLGIQIAERAVTEAHTYQLTSIELELLFLIRGNQTQQGDYRGFEESNERLRETLQMLEAEYLSREYLDRMTIQFANIEAEQPELAQGVMEYVNKLEPIRERFQNFHIDLNYYRLRASAEQIGQNYADTIRTCEDAVAHLKQYPQLVLNTHLGEFALRKLSCLLQLRDYERGSEAAQECAELFSQGSNNWFTYMESFFLLSMHTQHFEEANAIFIRVTTHERFNSLQETRKEKWKIFELYVNYVLMNTDSLERTIDRKNTVDRKRMLRMVPTYSRDKFGYNIPLLVLHILYLLDQHDLEGIVNRMEALKAYRTKYLTMKTNRQSALFFKLLLIMVSHSFDYGRTKQKGEKYFQQMISAAGQAENFNESLQILPYDWLWPHILERLRQIKA